MESSGYAGTSVEVRPADGSKCNGWRNGNAERQHRLRIRRKFEDSGEAFLYVECRECGKPIKPSFRRGFCKGGACREAFFKKVQVPTFIRLDAEGKAVAERVHEILVARRRDERVLGDALIEAVQIAGIFSQGDSQNGCAN